jgi:hypothetical protein
VSWWTPLAAVDSEGHAVLDPGSVVEAAADAWAGIWSPGGPILEGRADGQVGCDPGVLPALTGEMLEAVVRACPTGKAGGPDGWAIGELRALPRP